MDKKTITGKKFILRRVYHELWPIIILLFFTILFFFRLFPSQQIFMIPDFGESDVLHLNLPLKNLLSESLKNHQWPLWSGNIAGGFPILAEGQIGTFFLPNLMLFRFLPIIIAYNLNLFLSFSLAGIGMYLFLKENKLAKIPSLFGSLTFTFSGLFAVHLNHFNLIQAASLLPLIFLFTLKTYKRPTILNQITLSFLLCQQIFTGHFYIVFITLIGIMTYWFILLSIDYFKNKKILKTFKKSVFLFLPLLFSLFLSAIQLIPTIELWQISNRKQGLSFETVTAYPYPLKHLLSFVFPYIFGSPANGSYPIFNSNWGIFWENTAYVGIIALLTALFSLVFLKSKLVKIMAIILALSILLVLGKDSPFYFIFSFPLFNSFRVPSKFLLLTVFSLAVLAGLGCESIFRKISVSKKWKKYLYEFIILILFLSFVFDEFSFSYKYPPLSPASDWISRPKALNYISNNKDKIISLGAVDLWNRNFLNSGWQDMTPYVYQKNMLSPNYNLMFNLPSVDINTGGLVPRRTDIYRSIFQYYEIKNINDAYLTPEYKNAINLLSVKHVITPYNLSEPDFKKTAQVSYNSNSLPNINIYENKYSRPLAYLSHKTIKIQTLEDFVRKIATEDFGNNLTVLTETDNLPERSLTDINDDLTLVSKNDNQIIVNYSSNSPGILVVSDNNYPGWKAYLDGKQTEIITVNIVQKGIIAPSGNHQADFIYQPSSFLWGKLISEISWFIAFLMIFLSNAVSRRRASDNNRLSDRL